MNQAQFQVQVMAELKIIKEQTAKVGSGAGASTFGAGGRGNPIPQPVPPAGKSYAVLVARYGEAEFAKLVRLNTAGFPETNPALVPYCNFKAEAAEFIRDFPQYFQ